MKKKLLVVACSLATGASSGGVYAQDANKTAEASKVEQVVVTGKRENRVSKGATGLPLDIKDTPQTISLIDKQDIADFGVTGSNDALRLGTGINVEQYETNRAVFNSRGFEVQLTQIDGLGMSNDWGTVVGQLDTYLFDRIELIRGANGLLTGVGNSSGTINYVRKRPKNVDGGEIAGTWGAYSFGRGAFDYNKVLTKDGNWAARVVIAHEDKASYLRDLKDKRTSVYGVVDGQIGDNGVLTIGLTSLDAKQKSPMWGSLTLNRIDGTQADFDVSSSTSQKWTYWNTRSQSAFVEYTHNLGQDWEAKATYNHPERKEDIHLLYAYSPSGALNADNTGLIGWPYGGITDTTNDVIDANISGKFTAFGRKHSLLAGITHSRQKTETSLTSPLSNMFLPLPAFPYGGSVYPEPAWGPATPDSGGKQQLTRLYLASRLTLTDSLKAIAGANAVRLEREGSSLYGSAAVTNAYPKTEKFSPYFGLTYDLTPAALAYVSYSDIFQNQDQTDINGAYLAPTKGVNLEAGLKAEWLDRKLLTTFAAFTSEQRGLANFIGINPAGSYYYGPADVKSKGFEFEATGRLSPDTRLTVGLAHLKLTGPDGKDTFEWVPRTTVNFRVDTRVGFVPGLRLGVGGRWQSDVSKAGGARQDAYFLANAFAAYELTKAATVRVNINNLFDKKYIGGLSYGAIYGAPRNAALTLEYKL